MDDLGSTVNDPSLDMICHGFTLPVLEDNVTFKKHCRSASTSNWLVLLYLLISSIAIKVHQGMAPASLAQEIWKHNTFYDPAASWAAATSSWHTPHIQDWRACLL